MAHSKKTIVPLDDIKLMVADITKEHRFKLINEWEQGFIANIAEHAANNIVLSERQYDCLSKIYEKATEQG
jgi:hypothetical protein